MENKYLDKFRDFLDSGTTKANMTKVGLAVIILAAMPGLVVIAASMGNAIQVLNQFKGRKKYSKKEISNIFTGMKRQKLIEYITDKNGETTIKITKKGESRLHSFEIDLISIKKQKKWDGKWHMVMYDLPLRFKKARESLRWKLKDLGFYQFQKSVWIYPYPCEDEIIFVADFYGVGKYVEILVIENILRDEKLKKYFNLN
ncbi:MAG: hypothetical protein KBD52_00410 [Candidatus Pacebacteria bacterium]|nr:hypothetical protein [Candidatus Paceibacterota bacterium]